MASADNEEILYSYFYSTTHDYLEKLTVTRGNIGYVITPEYDNLGRTVSRSLQANVNGTPTFYNRHIYSYRSVNDNTTGLISQFVSQIRRSSGGTILSTSVYNYTYDDVGNITQITDRTGVVQYKYEYDDLGQLISEENKAKNERYVYAYDKAGNITGKLIYALDTGSVKDGVSYTYSAGAWGDQLIKFGNDNITYDAIGNPIDVSNGTNGASLTWQGRQLKSYTYYTTDGETVTNGTSIAYEYNADGIRTSKTVNGIEHKYLLDGTQIVSETWTENGVEYMLVFYYDEAGSPIGLGYRTNTNAEGAFANYFFDKNLQGDIVAVYNSSRTKIGTYIYDAWGTCTYSLNTGSALDRAVFLNFNPFRYRGYFYDIETELYYLQTRYYNPSWCRFVTPDNVLSGVNGSSDGFNLYLYCFNDPINLIDSSGNWPEFVKKAYNWVSDKFDSACGYVGEVINKVFSGDALNTYADIILSNVDIEAGICVGMGGSFSVGDLEVEAISRMDIIGVDFGDKKLRFGHNGRSGASVSVAGFSYGQQSNVFESFDGDREVETTTGGDFGISHGASAAFVIGYHYSFSISIQGIFSDMVDYFKEERE